MSSVDAEFVRRSGSVTPTFLRHVDDYWVGGNSVEECERHLSNLRGALRDHELDINESKTKIISTKYVFSDAWPIDFERELDAELASSFGSSRLLPLLSAVTDLATKQNDDGIIRRVIRKIDEKRRWNKEWVNLEHFLAQCALQFPHSFDYVARVISWRHRFYKDVDTELWEHVAHSCARSRGAAGYDSECVWALWLLKEIGKKVPKEISNLLIEACGPLVLAFMAHMGVRGLLSDGRWRANLIRTIEGDPLSGPSWPLTLELMHLRKGESSWLDPKVPQILRALHEERKSIIDWSAFARGLDEPDDPEDRPPEGALEDYGDDYGGFSDDDDDEDNDDDENGDEGGAKGARTFGLFDLASILNKS